jgi:hypothetical protein
MLRLCEYVSRSLLLAYFINACLKSGNLIPLGVYCGLQFVV